MCESLEHGITMASLSPLLLEAAENPLSPALAGDPHPPRDASPSESSFHALGIFMQWVKIPGGFGGPQVPTGRWEMLGSRQGRGVRGWDRGR